MMSVRHLFRYILIFIITMVLSCTKTADGIQGPAGPDGAPGNSVSDVRSAIYGFTYPVSAYGDDDTLLDQIHVSTRMGDSLLDVKTDQTGKFILPGLKSGTYRLMFKRSGFDSIGVKVIHSAGNEDQFIGLTQIDGSQTTKILSQTYQILTSPFDDVTKYLDLFTTIDGPQITEKYERFMDIYFSDSPNLNLNNSLYVFNGYTHNEGTNTFETQIFFWGTEINSNRFHPGDTVYMKSYIVPAYSLQTSWFDIASYQTISYPYIHDSLSNYFIWSN